MRLDAAGGPTHLTYCTNIHPGEGWPDVKAALQNHLPQVKRRVSPDARMGVGLRLAAEAAATLVEDPESLVWLSDFLMQHDLYVFTINGFPYGRFHGTRVKQEVYRPDWRHPSRLTYTNQLADLLAAVLPPNLEGTISTAPGGFRSLAADPHALGEIAEALIHHAAHLIALRERTGRSIALALEPEPMCLFETVEEVAQFFEAHLFSRTGISRLAVLTGLSLPAAEEAARRHLGLCYDVCHAAVEFEEVPASMARLRRSGIAVAKIQLSSALRIPAVDAPSIARLRPFDDGVYLHQVVERRDDGRLIRYLDLDDAFAGFERGIAEGDDAPREWRVHFHVPVFHDDLGGFGTTQSELREILALQRRDAISQHLEVETYTWDVLPPELREAEISDAIARELLWVRGELVR